MISPELKLLLDLQKQIADMKKMLERLSGGQRMKTRIKGSRVPSKEEFHQMIDSRMMKKKAA